jgi:hypothetical protein
MERVTGGLPIVGSITEEGKRCAEATITLYEGNEVINTFKTPRNGRFQLLLHTDKYYTLEVTKQGYVQKRIAINTDMGNRRISVPVYACDLDIIPDNLFRGIDIGDLDFPKAIVSFEPKTREFTHNEIYTSSMRTIYEGLLKEAYAKNGMAMNR